MLHLPIHVVVFLTYWHAFIDSVTPAAFVFSSIVVSF